MKQNSRRNQVLLLLLVLTSVSLITVDHRQGDSSPLNGLRHVAAATFGPVEEVIGGMSSGVGERFRRLSAPRDADDVARLEKENAQLRRQLRSSELARTRARELDALLRVAAVGQYRTVPAEVIAVAPAQTLSRTVTIDAGSRDGIAPNMTVINGDGLVGRVRTVAPWTSTVLLAVDPASAVGVRLERSSELAIASGAKDTRGNTMRLQLLDSQAAVRRGDRLVTYGSRAGRPYVPGVPVGTVRSVRGAPGALTRVATVTPYVDFTALAVVGVVVEPPRQNPRDSVLPPRPDAGDQSTRSSGRPASEGR